MPIRACVLERDSGDQESRDTERDCLADADAVLMQAETGKEREGRGRRTTGREEAARESRQGRTELACVCVMMTMTKALVGGN